MFYVARLNSHQYQKSVALDELCLLRHQIIKLPDYVMNFATRVALALKSPIGEVAN